MPTQTGSLDLKAAKAAHDVAKTSATNYFTDLSNGVFVHAEDVTNLQPTDSSAYGVSIKDTVEIIREGQSVAEYGTSARIGKLNESRVIQDYHSFQMIDKDGNTYVHLSDLRDSTGSATITDVFYGDGSTREYSLSTPATNTNYTVTVSDSSGGTVTKATGKVTFSTAPTERATITVVYTTSSSVAKAFTFGNRNSYSNIGALSFATGSGVSAEGYAAFVEGDGSKSTGSASHAEGQDTTASGNGSHAEGWATIASYEGAHSEGVNTTASGGWGAHAEGYNTTASGKDGAHAEGYNTTASDEGSHAEGVGSIASASASHAQNIGTTAASEAQTAIGKYNKVDALDKYSFIIGNGTGSALSNAFALTWNGDIEFECTSGTLYTALNSAGWLSEVTA